MLELFILESCPYCRKVMDYFEKNNIEYTKKDINEQKNLDELMKLGCKSQVPFLYNPDENLRMYESEDIIQYAAEKKNNL